MSKFHRGFKGEFKFLREEFEFFVLVSSVITYYDYDFSDLQ